MRKIAAVLEFDEDELMRAWNETQAERRAQRTIKAFDNLIARLQELASASRAAPDDDAYQMVKRVDLNDLLELARAFGGFLANDLGAVQESEPKVRQPKSEKKKPTKRKAGKKKQE